MQQQDLLRAAMALLRMTRDQFARRFGLSRRALDAYLLPAASAESRPLPEVARRYVNEVVWLFATQALTYTRSVHIIDFPQQHQGLAMDPQIDPMLVRFEGARNRKDDSATVRIVVDGVPRPLPFHLGVVNHSPMGFEWGYPGSGPSQLALAMCVALVGPVHARKVYGLVKERIVMPLSKDKWSILGSEVMEVIDEAAATQGENAAA